MTPEKYEDIREAYIEHITDLIADMGALYPHVTVFADQIDPKEGDEDKPAIIHIPIPEQLTETDEGKEQFVEEILPDVFATLKKQFVPYAVAWSSEAWMRVIGKTDKIPDNYKDIPIKKEVIIITLETSDKEEVIIYEIKRDGKQVNQFGDFIDKVELIPQPDMAAPTSLGGRFSGLFKKFND
jgi:hypothetical protein